jgi:hypothetical protein
LGGGAPPPERTYVNSFTPSPAYQQDHTVYASASGLGCSGAGPCPAVLVSGDSGHSWQSRRSLGFAGGTILPPPGPAGPQLFALDPNGGLQRSDDGGDSFRLVVPGQATFGMVATPVGGDVHVMAAVGGAPPLTVYSSRLDRLVPGPVLPPDLAGVLALVPIRGSADVVVIGVDQLGAPLAERCTDGGSCSALARPPAAEAPVLSSTFATDHVAFYAAANPVGVVVENMVTGATTTLSATRQAVAVSVQPASDYDGSRRVREVVRDQGDSSIHLLASVDGGALTDQHVQLRSDEDGAPLFVLPDGRILVTLLLNNGGTGGPACSADGGITWGDC